MIPPPEKRYSGPERREFPRVEGITAVYTVVGRQELEAVGFVVNLSAKGINLNVNRRIENNTILSLRMNLPGSSSPVQFKGKVVWGKQVDVDLVPKEMGYKLGIEFTEVSDKDRQKISEYVSSCLKK